MATITPNHQTRNGAGSYAIWENVTENDTCAALMPSDHAPIVGAIQADDTTAWGGATLELHGSVDNVEFFQLKDIYGTAISMTANGYAEFSTAARYIKPVFTTLGTSRNVTVHVNMRG